LVSESIAIRGRTRTRRDCARSNPYLRGPHHQRPAEEWFGRDRFGPSAERRELQFLEWLAPPAWHKAPAHRNQITAAVLRDNGVYRGGWTDIEPRPQIVGRNIERQPVKPDDFLPGQRIGRTAAHVGTMGSRSAIRRAQPLASTHTHVAICRPHIGN
jgi:hypothetical protein